jgi:hypothetical protein
MINYTQPTKNTEPLYTIGFTKDNNVALSIGATQLTMNRSAVLMLIHLLSTSIGYTEEENLED